MSDDLKNLANAVKARREQKDWTQHDVWNQGGPSNSTLTAVEAARAPGPSRSTLRKLDAGLQWVPGSAKEALAGYPPTALEHADPVGRPTQDPDYVASPGVRLEEDGISSRELRDELRAIRTLLERMEERDKQGS